MKRVQRYKLVRGTGMSMLGRARYLFFKNFLLMLHKEVEGER